MCNKPDDSPNHIADPDLILTWPQVHALRAGTPLPERKRAPAVTKASASHGSSARNNSDAHRPPIADKDFGYTWEDIDAIHAGK